MPFRLSFVSLLALLLASVATCSSASAATFTVVGTADTPAGTGCLVPDQCPSVRAAVEASAGTPEADTILLGANEYQLTNGQLVLGSPVDIVGVNARTTVIRGNAEGFRVLAVPQSSTASISRVTLRDGLALDENGGGFLAGGVVLNRGTLSLDRVRITGGRASSGGGLANLSGTVTITRSLIDGNAANLGGSDSGGLLNFNGGTLAVRDSTITANTGNGGAGVFSWGDAGVNTTTLERVTVSGNVGTGVGFSPNDVMRLRGSIVAANSGPDCGAAVVSLGANLESATACGLTGAGDLQSANPGFATAGAADNGGDTDTFALAATSPAIDRVPDCTGTDQRGAARPQRAACDTGAYEVTPTTITIDSAPPSPTRDTLATIAFTTSADAVRVKCRHVFPPGGGEEVTDACTSPWSWRDLVDGTHSFELTPFDAAGLGGAPAVVTVFIDAVAPAPVAPAREGESTFTFEASEPGASFACRLEGPSGDSGFVACSSPQAYPGLAAGDYRFTLRTLDAVGNAADAAPLSFSIAAPQPQPTATATAATEPVATPRPVATPTPTPQAGKTVVARPVSGKILVKRPNSSEFVELRGSDGIPVGSEVNAKNGRVALTIEPGNGKPSQRAVFYAGIFKISQPGATVDLTLSEPLAACPKSGAVAAQSKPKSRKLWGDGKGKFRTKGSYSSATVRGTIWLVQDSCEGTLTRVRQGVVSVRDSGRKKTVLLRAGRSYLAKPRRG